MIVISGALVLMAAVLLIIGLLASGSLTAIYVSIGLSIVAAVFLWIGINQRPVEVPAAAGVRGGGDRPDRGGRQREDRQREDQGESDQSSQQRRSNGKQASDDPPKVAEHTAEVTQQIDVMSDDLIEDSDERTVAAAVATGADVVVVSGFPRYHLDECPAVTGNDEAESLPIGEARELGFVPCGACRPDSEIAENAALPHTSNGSAAPALPSSDDSTPSAEPELVNAPPAVAAQAQQQAPPMPPPAVVPPPGADVQSPAPTAPQQPVPEVPAVAPPLAASAQPVAYQQQPATQWAQPAPPVAAQPAQWEQPAAPVAQQPVQQPAPPVAQQPVQQAAPPVVQQPVQQPAPPVAQQPAQWEQPVAQPPVAQPTATEQVVVLPGKARFHRQGCRLVSGSEPTETLDKADAVRQGYLACAICKP